MGCRLSALLTTLHPLDLQHLLTFLLLRLRSALIGGHPRHPSSARLEQRIPARDRTGSMLMSNLTLVPLSPSGVNGGRTHPWSFS